MYIYLSFAMLNTGNTLGITAFSICWSLTAKQNWVPILPLLKTKFSKILISAALNTWAKYLVLLSVLILIV